MAETRLDAFSPREKLNKMAVDLIDVTLTTIVGEHADNIVVSQSIEIPNAVAVKGGSAIIQSIYLQSTDNDVESPALELIFAAENTALRSSDVIEDSEITDGNLVGAVIQGSTTVSNWSTLTPSENEFAVKTNIEVYLFTQ